MPPCPYNPRQLALTPGTRLGPYEVIAQIGAGGMEVYKATDTSLKRAVAMRQYDVARDGRFLINNVLDDVAVPIALLQNWNPEAKK